MRLARPGVPGARTDQRDGRGWDRFFLSRQLCMNYETPRNPRPAADVPVTFYRDDPQ